MKSAFIAGAVTTSGSSVAQVSTELYFKDFLGAVMVQ